mmetsp:Transcript_130330/g.278498  ORF Transcript_130330/g.278498 Transcript_130330/m.278498 type:complete len:212 (-) Transcript_130330:1561-2196(-)
MLEGVLRISDAAIADARAARGVEQGVAILQLHAREGPRATRPRGLAVEGMAGVGPKHLQGSDLVQVILHLVAPWQRTPTQRAQAARGRKRRPLEGVVTLERAAGEAERGILPANRALRHEQRALLCLHRGWPVEVHVASLGAGALPALLQHGCLKDEDARRHHEILLLPAIRDVLLDATPTESVLAALCVCLSRPREVRARRRRIRNAHTA